MFVVYRLQPRGDGKTDKIPCDPYTGVNIDAQNPECWLLPHEALVWASQWGAGYGVGVVLYASCGLACIDLDNCRGDNGGWLPHVRAFADRFPGSAVETSVSRTGRHIFVSYTGEMPEHGTRNKTYRMEAYTRARFIAVTGDEAAGDVLKDNTEALRLFLVEFFPQKEAVEHGVEWTNKPVEGHGFRGSDDELIEKARRSHNIRGVFGAGARFEDLWTGNAEILARAFPSQTHDVWDRSAADQALANWLAFFTANDCERMWNLMQRSALVRPKWERFDNYIRPTILDACGTQHEWYTDPNVAHVSETSKDVPTISPESVPPGVPPPPTVTVELIGIPPPPLVPPPPATTAEFSPLQPGELPAPSSYCTVAMMRQIFAGMCYVEDIHKIQRHDGTTIAKDRFDAMYGGGCKWAMTADGQKPSKSPWEAYVDNEIHQFPRVHTQYFAPAEPTGVIRTREGRREINCYKAAEVRRVQGDPTPLITHLQKLLPQDWELMLYTMAGRVQFIGEKYMWAPFMQGCKGNGKTLLGKVLEYAIGPRYVHWPKSDQVDEKFNASFADKLMLIVDELPKNGYDIEPVLNALVTSTRLETRPMYAEKIMKDVCFNLWFISNYQGSLQCDPDQRRYAPFFCAQQHKKDLARDGLTPTYFMGLRSWLAGDGYAICAEYLSTLAIPPHLTPSTCVRAPDTSSTYLANVASRAPAEQEIHHAIEQGYDGFLNGWCSSIAVDQLLARVGKDKAIPRNQREALIESCGYIPHPALRDGLLTVPLPDGTQPRLYIREGHPWAVDYLTPEQIRVGFLDAQKK